MIIVVDYHYLYNNKTIGLRRYLTSEPSGSLIPIYEIYYHPHITKTKTSIDTPEKEREGEKER